MCVNRLTLCYDSRGGVHDVFVSAVKVHGDVAWRPGKDNGWDGKGGRCASATQMGQACGKSMGNMMDLGQDCGVAAAMSAQRGIQPRALPYQDVQKRLVEMGVDLNLSDAPIAHYCMRHEEACTHAADGYFRASHRIALAICTSGPGATNFVTGLYTARIDSIPMLAITGQANTWQLDMDPFQCVDIAAICAPVTKKAFCLKNPEDLPAVMREAFFLMRSGKPGPVLLDLPLDVQMAEIDFAIDDYQPQPVAKPAPSPADIEAAARMLAAAKAPVIIMGGGVTLAQAEPDVIALAELLQIPVVTTYMAKGGLPEKHPLSAGHVGIQVGQPIGNRTFLDSDLVLGIGCRFSDRHTGDFGFTFMGEEIAVAAALGKPIIVIILNNACLGLIRQNQKGAYGYEYAVDMPYNQDGRIDYVQVAQGYGCRAERVFTPDQKDEAIARAKASGRTYVIDAVCNTTQLCDMGGSIAAVKSFAPEG